MNSITIKTPIGYLYISESAGKITQIEYKDKQCKPEGILTDILLKAKQQLEEYFDGTRKTFELPFEITGSDFTIKVLEELAKVPYGHTVTYSQLAKRCGNPKAARAVGTVMRKNKFVIVLPCHRVLPKGETIGNYSAGGAANKEWLLLHERQNSSDGLLNILNLI